MASARFDNLQAVELARLLARRQITARDLLTHCLARIEEREDAVQAWEFLDVSRALSRADDLDHGPLSGPLHGLPIGLKDIIDAAGMPTRMGSSIYADNHPRADAALVATARQQGAVMLGKTVTTELATGTPARTRNPVRLSHTPGASSSGSAAAVADGMVPLALGTQTAGSIIRPAAYCGVVGYKPSFGKLVRAGVKVQCETVDTVGVFGRSVADVALLVGALANDAGLMDVEQDAAPRIGLCRTPEWRHADASTQRAMERAAERLGTAGVTVRSVEPALLANLSLVQTEVMFYEAAQAYAWERHNYWQSLGLPLQKMLQAGAGIPAERHARNLERMLSARREMADVFRDVDVLLAPSTTGEAPDGLSNTGDPMFCRAWSLLGLPCVHLPFTLGVTGMPVGLQVVGPFMQDRQTLRAAHWMWGALQEAD